MAYVERHRGGRHLVEAETGIDECSGWQPICTLDEIPDGRGRPVTDLATLRPDVARRTDLEYML